MGVFVFVEGFDFVVDIVLLADDVLDVGVLTVGLLDFDSDDFFVTAAREEVDFQFLGEALMDALKENNS